MADYINKIRTTEGDKPVNYEALANKPNSLPNPNKIKFTGSVVAEYDGSSEVTVDIPNGASEEQAAQIQTNTNDISELKNKTSELKGDLTKLDNAIFYISEMSFDTIFEGIICHYPDTIDYVISGGKQYRFAPQDDINYYVSTSLTAGADNFPLVAYLDSDGNFIGKQYDNTAGSTTTIERKSIDIPSGTAIVLVNSRNGNIDTKLYKEENAVEINSNEINLLKKTIHEYEVAEYYRTLNGRLYNHETKEYDFVTDGVVVEVIANHDFSYYVTTSFSGGSQYPAVTYLNSEGQYISHEYVDYEFNLEKYKLTVPNNAYLIVVNGRYVNPLVENDIAKSGLKPISVLNGTRNAVINFQFDDGYANDASIVNIFKAKNAVCGFALLSTIEQSRVSEYLSYQNEGFEILSHSTDNTPSAQETNPVTIEDKMRTSKAILENLGFNIRGWVTPSSQMPIQFRKYLRKYYDFAHTVYLGAYTDANSNPSNTIAQSEYDLQRVSVQTTTFENMKKAVDKAIENGGFLTFYGHSSDLDGSDNLTTSNLNALLDYINSKKAEGKCAIMKPSDCYDDYYKLRHDDFILLN